MSRWDSLRPERREGPSRKAFPQAHPSTRRKLERRSADSSLDWHRQLTKLNDSLKEGNKQYVHDVMDKLEGMLEAGADIPPKSAGDAILSLMTSDSPGVAETRRLQFAARILAQHKVIMTNHQVNECIDSLKSSSEPCRIDCMARMILIFSRQMQAEVTANELVGNTLLPVLEKATSDNVLIVLDALQCLVNHPLHASALLAPLTLHVTEEGQEDIITNPLRNRITRALQALLRNKTYSDKACVCLISVIKIANPTAGDVNEYDLSLLNSFFADATRQKTGHGMAFELMRVVLKAYPTTGTVFSNLLIGDLRWQSQTDCASCVHCTCKHQNTAPLMDMLHSDSNDRIATVVPCIQELLESLPLHLWLSTSRPSTGLQHFGKRAKDSLVRLLQVVKCRFQHRPLSIPDLCPLIYNVITQIPYLEDDRDELTREAMQLPSVMTQELMRRPHQELIECFVSCMGGRPQPQGGMSLMPIPMHMWLSSFLSRDFRRYLWSAAESRTGFREDAVKILCAIVQSVPSFVLADEVTWERCQNLIMAYTSDSFFRIRLDGVMLLETLLSGRVEMGGVDGDDEKISLFASSIAWRHLNDTKPHFRNTSLNCYGYLLSSDWVVLSKISDNNGHPSFQDHVNGVLAHCVKSSEPNAGVRSKACRSIGHICTQYISSLVGMQTPPPIGYDDMATRVFCRAVCETLMISLQDSSGIKEMAVFAVGNLAHAVRESKSNEALIPPNFFQPLCEAVYHCMNENSGKVVNNAIRTIGHLVFLAFHPPYINSGTFDDWDVISFYGNVLGELDRKIEAALMAEASRNASWKQRSTAKKHGWGACNSLALLLDCDKAFIGSNLKQAQDSLSLLVRCINEAGSVHEKVASAAIAAIRKISDTALTIISREASIIGMALAPCLVQLYRVKMQRQNKSRLELELKLLLAHLLRATTISDACYLLRQDDIGKSTLEFLYEWMVGENMPLGAFESFALALQRRDLLDDASLQQRFAARVLQMSRNSGGDDNDEL